MTLAKSKQPTGILALKRHLTVVFLMSIGAVAGAFLGYMLFLEVLPPLVRTHIQLAYPISELLFVRFGSTFNTTANDILYVRTTSGEIYSIAENNWRLVEALPNNEKITSLWSQHIDSKTQAKDTDLSEITVLTQAGSVFKFSNNSWQLISTQASEFPEDTATQECAYKWVRHPSEQAEVIISKGVFIDRPLLLTTRCYVLFDKTHLEVWTFETGSHLFIFLICFGVSIGGIIGGVAGFKIIRRHKTKVSNYGVLTV